MTKNLDGSKESVTNSLTRRQVVVGSTALAGLAAASTSSFSQEATPQTAQAQTTSSAKGGKLSGRVAPIAGAARGIGRATALVLAREGADIVAIDIADPKALENTLGYSLATTQDLIETERLVKALGQRCLTIKADVRNMALLRQAVERTINELGKLDILVANAGILPRMPLDKVTDKVWDDTIGINLTGVGNAIRAVAPHMIERKSGRIVAIASAHARYGAHQRHVYTASKWGVIGLVKSVALELSEHMITVNAVSPGFIRTGMTENAETFRRLRPDLANPTYKDVASVIVKQRQEENLLPIALLEPEDVANGVLYLVSDEARYITGVALDITAGENAHYTA
ncbi:mycofactocin-coupled SDR family oxidoreductase [Scytonema sp. NUACC26]|uniref:mycofactocin-coupled SDR family oxidoreductase n=1 Tax=Scytonema sp. NUACC26 TaxID=3140176 RepID=UPI0034DC8504